MTKLALKLLDKEQPIQGNGLLKKYVDDLDLIMKELGKELRIPKEELRRQLKNRNILIQMKKFRVRWDATTGYVQATYEVFDKVTNKLVSLNGHVIGREGLTGGIFDRKDEITFRGGEYIKELTAVYNPLTGTTSNIKVITSLGKEFSFALVQLLTFNKKIELKNIACLTGYKGLLYCCGLGAWTGEEITNQIQQPISSSNLNQQDNTTDIKKIDLEAIILKKIKSIEEKYQIDDFASRIKIDTFETWFNPNCAIIKVNKSKKWDIRNVFVDTFETDLVIYEPAEKEREEIFRVIKIFDKNSNLTILNSSLSDSSLTPLTDTRSNLDETMKKIKEVKEALKSDNPVYAAFNFGISPSLLNHKPFSNEGFVSSFDALIFLTTFRKELEIDVNFNPEEYLRPLDIIWIKRLKKNTNIHYYHVGIYLYNNKNKKNEIVNISNFYYDEETGKEVEKIENYYVNKKTRKKVEKVKKIKGARKNSWQEFLKDDKKIVIYHTIIPFKRSELINEQIEKVIDIEYRKGEYSLRSKNCEHLANMLIYGIDSSHQVLDKFERLATGTLEIPSTSLVAKVASAPFNRIRELSAEKIQKDPLLILRLEEQNDVAGYFVKELSIPTFYKYLQLKKKIEESNGKFEELRKSYEQDYQYQIQVNTHKK